MIMIVMMMMMMMMITIMIVLIVRYMCMSVYLCQYASSPSLPVLMDML